MVIQTKGRQQMADKKWVRPLASLLIAALTISILPIKAVNPSLVTRPDASLVAHVHTHSVNRLLTDDSCPPGWRCGQLGDPNVTGSQEAAGATWTISGTGVMPDNVRFVWQSIGTHGGVSARVVSQPAPGGDNVGAGVMIRDGTQPGAALYSFYATTAHLLVVRIRAAQSQGDGIVARIAGDPPAYLRVARSGDTFTAFTSRDGRNWHVVPNSGVTIHMGRRVEAGIAVALGQPGAAVINNAAVAATGDVASSSLSERSLPTSFIVLWEGKIASVARILTSKRPPSALSSEKTRSLRQTASGGDNTAPQSSGNVAQVIQASWVTPNDNFAAVAGTNLNLEASFRSGKPNNYRLPGIVRFNVKWSSGETHELCSVPLRDARIEDTRVSQGGKIRGNVVGLFTCKNAHIPTNVPTGAVRLTFDAPGMNTSGGVLSGTIVPNNLSLYTPDIKIVAYIAPIEHLDCVKDLSYHKDLVAGALREHHGDKLTAGNAIDDACWALGDSSNDPPPPFLANGQWETFKSSQEYRGYIHIASMKVTCDRAGVHSPVNGPSGDSSSGWTKKQIGVDKASVRVYDKPEDYKP